MQVQVTLGSTVCIYSHESGRSAWSQKQELAHTALHTPAVVGGAVSRDVICMEMYQFAYGTR